MRFGYQKGYWIFRFNGKQVFVGVNEVLCILAGIILFFAMEVSGRDDPLKEGYIRRNEYGKGEEEIVLIAEGIGDANQAMEVVFPVEERRYTKEQTKKELEALTGRLPDLILGENPSTDQVRTKLNLIPKDSKTGFHILWSSAPAGLIGYDGEIYGESIIQDQGQLVNLTAEVSDGYGTSKQISIPIQVFAPLLSEEERQKKELIEEIVRREKQNRTEEGFYLPSEYKGGALSYRSRDETDSVWLLLIGPVLAILMRARSASQEKQLKKDREKKLLLDYSEVVSKLQIFLGAGMTIRTAWERIVLDYQKLQERGEEKRPAYEEMLQTYYQIRSGTAEGKAYGEFGRRCMLQPYLKLAGLLEQNRRTGTKNLRYLLQAEMTDAFEQRKNFARRQGEEAATKLLIPLFLMLGVVMVIVVVPAFLTFF